ncbi:DUF6992 family protein [Meiothermus taiwanensis]|jgi:hypothetical protein|uniref:Uncharacterized protein n=2 Tax=Meiothermus taiwanensis TaxID=172827 RepID=A0A399DV07_9DEIN|nr:hypothetical protein [Meiothermus taiwanensis]AWR86099.1 hypothetical protein Mtai_v1c08550 [Meiothermus taiwanensis WR-220]KIQ55701.1 hypothetical protein SY28_01925 [Meiothermus taiwanensis]KZK15032.1 hypothetical protein A3962_02830 [Meiothermus taiwanensis]RIH76015.1 hypothetical protein Mcate_01945 [Meiothermus taiwanensis]
MRRGPWFLLLACFAFLGLAQAQNPFSVGMAYAAETQQPGLQPERPPWDRLLFGPAPEGYRGLAISARLLAWSVPWSLVGSIVGLTSEDPWQRSFWLTHSVWAAVNSGIALVGLLGPEPEKSQLRNLLYINAGLDLLYIAGGVALALQPDPRSQGAGWAIALQGAWLLLFDLFNALALESP